MHNPTRGPESYPSVEEVFQLSAAAQRRAEFFDAVMAPSYVVSSELAASKKAFPDISSPLAARDDLEKFGVKQILHGILRTGYEEFGIVGAFGAGPLRDGFMFAVRLSDEPYSAKPDYVAHLQAGKRVWLGSRQLTAGFNDKSIFWALKRFESTSGSSDIELITAEPIVEDQRRHGVLVEEVGIWAPPPAFVKAKAAKTLRFKKNEPGVIEREHSEPSANKKNHHHGRHPRHHAGKRAEFRRQGRLVTADSLDLIDLFGIKVQVQ